MHEGITLAVQTALLGPVERLFLQVFFRVWTSRGLVAGTSCCIEYVTAPWER